MTDTATTLLRAIDDQHLTIFAGRLSDWLIGDLNKSREPVPDFTESRARALLRATNTLDDPTLHTFTRLVENETAVRLALYDLLDNSGLAEASEVRAIAATSAAADESATPVQWLALAIAAFAWKSGYPLHQLDPASPPDLYSPAGQLVKRAAYFMRQQVQRSATERDKLGRQLAHRTDTVQSGAATLDDLRPTETIPPLPPHFRPPIPVRYPEVARDTLHIQPEEEQQDSEPAVTPNPPLSIKPDDLPPLDPPTPTPTTMPPIRIRDDQLKPEEPRRPPPRPRSTVVTPPTGPASRSSFTDSVRQMLGRDREPLAMTKLRIIVQEYADGPGLYGLQVKVSCQGVRSFVAGTTNRDGHFLCELPVRVRSGLTYHVDVTWPRDFGGDTERKSITLNADRTEFTLPFYQRIKH